MRAELKLLDVAAHALRRLIWIERDFITRLRISQNAGRRKGIRIADKKDRVLWIFEKTSRKNIGEGLWRHHPTRQRVNSSGAGRRVMNCLAIQHKRRHFRHQLQTGQLPPRGMYAAIINISHLRTETADVNWELRQ